MAQKQADPVLMKVMVDSFMARAKYDRVNFAIHQYRESITPDGESDTELLQRVINDIGVAIPAIRNSLISLNKIADMPGVPSGVADDIEVHRIWSELSLDDLDLLNTKITQMIMSKSDYVRILSNILGPYYDSTNIEEDFSDFMEDDEGYEEEVVEDEEDEDEGIDVFEAYNNAEAPAEGVSNDAKDDDAPIIYTNAEEGMKKTRVDPITLEPEEEEPADDSEEYEEEEEYEDDETEYEDESEDESEEEYQDESEEDDEDEESDEPVIYTDDSYHSEAKPAEVDDASYYGHEQTGDADRLFTNVSRGKINTEVKGQPVPVVKQTGKEKAQNDMMMHLLSEFEAMKAQMDDLSKENMELKRDNALLTAQMSKTQVSKEATPEDVMKRLKKSGAVAASPAVVNTKVEEVPVEEPQETYVDVTLPQGEDKPGILESVTEKASGVISKTKGAVRKTATKSSGTKKKAKRGRPKKSTTRKKAAKEPAVKAEEPKEGSQ